MKGQSMQAVAAILHEPNAEFSVEPIELDAPTSGQVMVKISAVGVCHTDLIFATGKMGTPFPVILGHEGAGRIASVGPDVEGLSVGDKVLLTFESCGDCPNCASHDPAYCHNYRPLNFSCLDAQGCTPAHSEGGADIAARFFGQSSFASHANVNARNVIKLPADADEALLSPLGCGVQTGAGAVMRSLGAKAGSSITVIGGGAVGLSAVMAAKIVGCSPIILVEPNKMRRDLSKELGATHTIDPMMSDAAEDIHKINPGGVQYVLDTSGNLGAIESGVKMMAPKAMFGFIGIPTDRLSPLPVSIGPMIGAGYTFKGIMAGDSDPQTFLPELVDLVTSGKMPLEKLVTYYPFDQINDAIKDSHSGGCIKAVLRFDTK